MFVYTPKLHKCNLWVIVIFFGYNSTITVTFLQMFWKYNIKVPGFSGFSLQLFLNKEGNSLMVRLFVQVVQKHSQIWNRIIVWLHLMRQNWFGSISQIICPDEAQRKHVHSPNYSPSTRRHTEHSILRSGQHKRVTDMSLEVVCSPLWMY